MFFHNGEWSESYHDEIHTGARPKAESRRQRVKAIVRWLDAAKKRGKDKLREREEMIQSFHQHGSPIQRMQRAAEKERRAKEAKERAEGKEGPKEAEVLHTEL